MTQTPPPEQSSPDGDSSKLPDNPRELRRYLGRVKVPKTTLRPPTEEERSLLNEALLNFRPTSWQRRELAQLIRGMSVAFLTHAILLIWALSTAVNVPLVKRGPDTEERFVRPVWIREEPKEEKKPVPNAAEEATENEDEEPALAKAPPPPPEEPKPKPKKIKKKPRKKRVVTKPKPEPKPSMAVVASEAPEAPASDVRTVDDGATGTEAPAEAEAIVGTEATPDGVKTGDVAAPEGPSIDLDGLRREYMGQLNARFQKERVYPRAARRAGIQGTVILEVTIDGKGKISGAKVLESSGHSILDAAALRAVKGVDDLPAPPKDLGWSKRSMRIPFVYRLS